MSNPQPDKCGTSGGKLSGLIGVIGGAALGADLQSVNIAHCRWEKL